MLDWRDHPTQKGRRKGGLEPLSAYKRRRRQEGKRMGRRAKK